LAFGEFDFYQNFRHSFSLSELGKIHRLLPLEELARSFGLKDSRLGRYAYFTAVGKVGLMFLKSHTGFSDKDLIENLNANPDYQLFCDIRIHPLHPLTNYKIVSAIRCRIAERLNIHSAQQVLASVRRPYLNHLSVAITDATCYKSFIRYPTDIKLLWEGIEWVHRHLKSIVKQLGLEMPGSKYDKQRKRYSSYSKKRKRKSSETRVLTRSLLHLPGKLTGLLQSTVSENRHRL
jgi:hypothetical protein